MSELLQHARRESDWLKGCYLGENKHSDLTFLDAHRHIEALIAEVERLNKQVVAIGGVAMDSIPRPRNTESIDRLFLELSQFTQATTAKELALKSEVDRLSAIHPVARIRRWTKDGGGRSELIDWVFPGIEELPDGEHTLYARREAA